MMDRLKIFIKHVIIRHQHDAININFDILKNILIQHNDYENILLDHQILNFSYVQLNVLL